MRQNVQVKMRPAYLLASFYTALGIYIDKFDAQPTYMVAMPDSGLAARQWLAEANSFASELPEEREALRQVLGEVEQLVAQKRYDIARRIVKNGLRDADGQIRALGRG